MEFPERCDDTSNAPLPAIDKLVSTDPSTERVAKPTKRDGSDLCLPNVKKICLAPSAMGEPHLTSLHSETLNVLQTVQSLLGGRASIVLMTLATFTYDQLCISPDMNGASIGLCVHLKVLCHDIRAAHYYF